jgi:hypothetical protein
MKVKKILAVLVLAIAASGQQTAVISQPPPTGATGAYVYTTGTTGGTFYCYWVITEWNNGMSQPGPPACLSNSNGTLSGGNFNTIVWNQNPPGGTPLGFWVVRSTTNTFPGTGTTAVNATIIANTVYGQTDTSNTLNAFTYTPVVGTAVATFAINNKDYGVPVVTVASASGAENIRFPQIAISPPATAGTARVVHVAEGQVTSAALASGVTIVAPIKGIQYTITGILLNPVGGQPATCATVNLVNGASTTQLFVSVPVATLTAGAWINESGANIVFNNFLVPLNAGVGVKLLSDTTCTTMTSINYRVLYTTGDRQ